MIPRDLTGSVWNVRLPVAVRALAMRTEHPEWSFNRIGVELMKEGMTYASGAEFEATAVLLLLMIGRFGLPADLFPTAKQKDDEESQP